MKNRFTEEQILRMLKEYIAENDTGNSTRTLD